MIAMTKSHSLIARSARALADQSRYLRLFMYWTVEENKATRSWKYHMRPRSASQDQEAADLPLR
jgi:hypothetical protein